MTNENKSREIKVGITVLTGLLLFIIVIMWAKNFSFDSEKQIIKVRFPNVSGLYVKDKVTVNGVEKGYVSDLKIDGNSVIAELTLTSDVDLRSDADFGIVMLDLMGGKKVEIKPGIAKEKLDAKKIHVGEFKGDVSEAMAMFNEMQADLSAIIKETKNITESLSEILGKENFGREISNTIAELNKTLSKTNSLLDQNSEDIRRMVKNGAEFSDSLNAFWKENGDKFSELTENTSKTLANLDSALASVNKILSEVNNGSNNLGKVLNDEEYLKKLNDTLANLNELMKILTEQLKGKGVNVNTNIF